MHTLRNISTETYVYAYLYIVTVRIHDGTAGTL